MGIIVNTEKVESINVSIFVDTQKECGIVAASTCELNVSVKVSKYCDHFMIEVGSFSDDRDAECFIQCAKEAVESAQKIQDARNEKLK